MASERRDVMMPAMNLRYGSVCSGIEAASVAWHPLGWRAAWLSEIEKFPSAVLAHHYPDVANLGDMTAIAARVDVGDVEAPDILVGGTPCQAFSVAGLRKGLNDARGQLTLKYVELADAIDARRIGAGTPPAILVWENVPGVLSSKDNAFGCFLGALAGEDCELQPPGKRWTDAGCVHGPTRTIAWRVLDAQYFGLAQRRRRVFVVASARTGFDPTAVLFESEGVRRDSAPSRSAGQNPAGTLAASTGVSDENDAADGRLIPFASATEFLPQSSRVYSEFEASPALQAAGTRMGNRAPQVLAFGAGNTSGPIDPAGCLTARGMRLDFEVETFVTQCVTGDVTHALKAEGADASEDGTGRGNPIVAVPILEPGRSTDDAKCGIGIGADGDAMFTLGADRPHGVAIAFPANLSGTQCAAAEDVAPAMGAKNPTAVAFSCKDHGQDAGEEVAPTLRSMAGAHANAGGQVAVAFAENSRAELRLQAGDGSICGALKVGGGKPDQSYPTAVVGSAVRRLTPTEHERLQGFPDGYTLVPYGHPSKAKLDADFLKYQLRGNPKHLPREDIDRLAADGPRYKALGNSMAVPCMAWIGRRIQAALA